MTHPFEKTLEQQLHLLMTEKYSVEYWPDFPRANGSSFSWFQLIFLVPYSNETGMRGVVHRTIEHVLPVLSQYEQICSAELVSIRSRCFGFPATERPVMFIQAYWPGTAFLEMFQRNAYSRWMQLCGQYNNRLSDADPF